jgi:hypothetical protein
VPAQVRVRMRVLVLMLVGERLRPVPVQLWGVVDLVERVPKSGGHHPERAVVPDRGYS